MPFLHRAGLGEGVDPFDFAVEGVTSISCDTVSPLRMTWLTRSTSECTSEI